MGKTCEIEILDLETGEAAFNIQLYGVSAEEMMCIPPPISVYRLLQRRGFDPTRYISSIFHVQDARRYAPRTRR